MFQRVLLFLALSVVLTTTRATSQRVDSLLAKAITDPAETFEQYSPLPTPDNNDMPNYGDYRHFYEQAVAFDYGFLRMRPRGLSQRYTELTYEGLQLTDPYYNTPLWSATTGLYAATNNSKNERATFFALQSYRNNPPD